VIRLLFALLLLGQPIPPHPYGSTLESGQAAIGWGNNVDADTVVVVNVKNSACLVPTMEPIDAHDAQVSTWVPNSTDPRCLLRPGDHVYLLRYRAGRYIDQIGPYIVPVKVWLPVIGDQ
jgi:hypothetical protein